LQDPSDDRGANRGAGRRWFQFRLRTVFVLMAVCAAVAGMYVWKIQPRLRERSLLLRLQQCPDTAIVFEEEVPWTAKLFGREGFAHITELSTIGGLTDEDLEHVALTDEIRVVELGDEGITTASLECLQHWPNLKSLTLYWTSVTREDVRRFHAIRPEVRVDLHEPGLVWTKFEDGVEAQLLPRPGTIPKFFEPRSFEEFLDIEYPGWRRADWQWPE